MKPDEKNNINPPSNEELIDGYDYLSNAASFHEMTGLIPSAPATEEELESYEELFHSLPPNGVSK